jgi:uncharacterized membrane-anchored protein
MPKVGDHRAFDPHSSDPQAMVNTHPLHSELHDEVHTRSRLSVAVPQAVAHAAVMHSLQTLQYPQPLLDWCSANGIEPPVTGKGQFTASVGSLRIRWEWHGEFHEYTAYAPDCSALDPFAANAADRLLAQWLALDPNPMIAGIRVAVLAGAEPAAEVGRAQAAFGIEAGKGLGTLVGAHISDQAVSLYATFRLDDAGFGRFLVIERDSEPAQLGRTVQRIIDIEVYRMMAMLAFPEARELYQALRAIEPDLAGLVARLDLAPNSEEPEMLHNITRLSADIEQLSTYSAYRLDSSRAYHRLVGHNLSDLRESRLDRLQTPSQFLQRRFEPAMHYCEAIKGRLESVSARIARASALLGTRVEIDRERQNQALLNALNERAALQLRLQQTVEGLSVAAISYYAIGLIGYVFKAIEKAGAPVKAELATGLAVVPVALCVWFLLHRAQRHFKGDDSPK